MTRLTRRAALKGGAGLAVLAPLAGACTSRAEGETAAPADAETVVNSFEDGVSLAKRIKAGETSAEAEVAAAISRARAVEPQINAIATASYEAAREAAAGAPNGPMAGVPTFIKDLEETAGVQTLYGSRAFEGFVPQADGPLAAKWRAGGLISLGKSTTPEMGLTATTEPLVTGATRNPWNMAHSTGGSSGGAAALVAARVVPFAHASDGGGSIRIPAACCGLFGLKPSRGRIARPTDTSVPVDISVDHAVTWTVRDSAALFALAETDEYPRLGIVREPLSRRLRIAYAPTPMHGGAVHPDVQAGADATAELCRELGHEVIDFTPPVDGARFTDAFILYWASGAAAFAQAASEFSGEPVGPDILEPLTLGLAGTFQANRDAFEGAVAYLKAFEARYHEWFEDFDVLLSPTVTAPPPPIGEFDPAGDFETGFAKVSDWVGYTPPMNVAGAASMSVPLAWSSDGLPIGMMFSGRRGDDGLLLQLAYQLEEARPWIDKVPPLTA